MSTQAVVTSIGLILDITGALLLAKDYWNPPSLSEYEKDGSRFDTAAQAKRTQELKRNYPYAKCGLYLLAGGFIIQLLAQWVKEVK